MRKFLLLAILLVTFVATSAFGIDFTISQDTKTVTMKDGKTYTYFDSMTITTSNNEDRLFVRGYDKEGDHRIISLIIHRRESRPFAFTITGPAAEFRLFGDFDCSGTWLELDPARTPVAVPDCAKMAE